MKNSILKNALFSLLVVILFFASLELYQRLKWYFRTQDESYLFYGATDIELSFAKYFNWLAKRHKDQAATEGHEIVIVGGSTVRCDGLTDNLTWPKQLEDMIRSGGHKNVTVYNLGKQGSISTDDVDRLRDFLRTHHPFLIIFYDGVNDCASMFAINVKGSTVLSEEIEAGFLERLNAILFKHSLFYLTVREKLAKVFQRDAGRCYHTEKRDAEKFQLVKMIDLRRKRFRSNLLRTIRLARNLKIELIFGSPPLAVSQLDYIYGTCCRKFYDILRSEMKEVSKENGISYIDVDHQFDLLRDKEQLFFPDKVHVNKYGAEREARIVYDFLNEQRVLNSIAER